MVTGALDEIVKTQTGRRPWGARARLYRALTSRRVDLLVTVLVLANAFLLALLCYEWSAGTVRALLVLDRFICAVFVMEIGLKLATGGWRFLRKPWNLFDTVIVAVGVLGSAYPLTVLRALRVLRTLRLVRRVPSMRGVVESFLRAVPGIASVLSVMLIVLFIYAVIGTRAYGEIAPESFGTLHDTAFTLFVILTLENWEGHAREVMEASPMAWIYFTSYIAVNAFVILNLIIAVIIEAMHRDYDEDADRERDVILAELQALRAEMADLLGRVPAGPTPRRRPGER